MVIPKKVFIEARVTDILKNQILQNIPLQMVSSMQIGVECGYNEGLKKIRKGLTVEQLFSALEILKQYQFDKHCFLFLYYRISMGNNGNDQ